MYLCVARVCTLHSRFTIFQESAKTRSVFSRKGQMVNLHVLPKGVENLFPEHCFATKLILKPVVVPPVMRSR